MGKRCWVALAAVCLMAGVVRGEDGLVNLDDVAVMAHHWQGSCEAPDWCEGADRDHSGVVDLADFISLVEAWLGPAIPPDMMSIPGGSFQMGDSLGDSSYIYYELPVHTVTLDAFYMGKYEITNQQYCAYLNDAYPAQIKVVSGVVYSVSDSNNSYPYFSTSSAPTGSPNYGQYSQIDFSNGTFTVRLKNGRVMSNDPVVLVSWYGAVAYCNWRSQQEGLEPCYTLSGTWPCDFTKHGYRLPTEAEWEYAARGGLSSQRFPWGNTINQTQANYYSYWSGGVPYYSYDVNPTAGYHPTWNVGVSPYTSPVGSFSPNGYGLYDMAGNVWEWCYDWYGAYSADQQTNPTGPTSGSYRVLRGGSWANNAGYCRVAARSNYTPFSRYPSGGFRVVLDYQ